MKKKVISTAKYIHQSPRKIIALANLIRPLPLEGAISALGVSVKKAAIPLKRLLLAAVADAEHNFGIKRETLKLVELQVSPAPMLKRVKFRARGRRDVVHKRNAHLRVVLEGEWEEKKTVEKKTKITPEKKPALKKVGGWAAKKPARKAIKSVKRVSAKKKSNS